MVRKFDEYKIGEILDDDTFEKDSFFDKSFKKPIKLVAVSYTIQDKNGNQADIKLKSDDYIESDDYDC